MGERIIRLRKGGWFNPVRKRVDRLIQEFENAGKATILKVWRLKIENKPIMLALNAKGDLLLRENRK